MALIKEKAKVGRPPKGVMSRQQVQLWATAVMVLCGVKRIRDLEEALGRFGEWDGMWGRYERGLVEPSKKRINRIEELVPGTEKYFSSGIWQLLENRQYNWGDLGNALETLPPDVHPELRRKGNFGRITSPGAYRAHLNEALQYVDEEEFGVHSLVVILAVIREAELVQDERQYLAGLQAWADACSSKLRNPVLHHLPYAVYTAVAEPLLDLSFSDEQKDASWRRFMVEYVDSLHQGEWPSAEEFDGLDCVSRFYDFTLMEPQVLRRMIGLKGFQRQLYINHLKHNGQLK